MTAESTAPKKAKAPKSPKGTNLTLASKKAAPSPSPEDTMAVVPVDAVPTSMADEFEALESVLLSAVDEAEAEAQAAIAASYVTIEQADAYLATVAAPAITSVDDWLAQDHLARFVVEFIDQLDLSELIRQYAGRGSDAYHPAMLLGLLVYGYASGVHSSRKIERATYDWVAFRYIAAGTHPDHDTLATFRRRFLDDLAELSHVVALSSATTHRLRSMRPRCR